MKDARRVLNMYMVVTWKRDRNRDRDRDRGALQERERERESICAQRSEIFLYFPKYP